MCGRPRRRTHPESARLPPVQRLMRGVGRGAGIDPPPAGQLDPAEVLDIGTLVELAGVAGGRVAYEEADRAPVLDTQPAVAQAVDDDPLLAERFERDGHVEIVAVRVEGHVIGLR